MTSNSQMTCSNCGIALRGTGPRSNVLAERFCMALECQRIKQRRYRAQLRHGQPEAPMDNRPCFNCLDDLPPRPPRVTDIALGRWCPKMACQRDRASRTKLLAAKEANARREPLPMTVFELQMLSARLIGEQARKPRVPCPECGRPNAIRGYPHPPMDDPSGFCYGTGEHPFLPGDLETFFGPGADTLEE